MKMTISAADAAPTHAPLTGLLTFRKDAPETGLASAARPWPDTAIRIAGLQVGTIRAPRPRGEDRWSVSLMVVDQDAKCGWRTIVLARRFEDEPSARLAIRGGDTALRIRHDLHQLKD
jgi:hypothetical protein